MKSKTRGFTLVELLITVAISAALTATLPAGGYNGARA